MANQSSRQLERIRAMIRDECQAQYEREEELRVHRRNSQTTVSSVLQRLSNLQAGTTSQSLKDACSTFDARLNTRTLTGQQAQHEERSDDVYTPTFCLDQPLSEERDRFWLRCGLKELLPKQTYDSSSFSSCATANESFSEPGTPDSSNTHHEYRSCQILDASKKLEDLTTAQADLPKSMARVAISSPEKARLFKDWKLHEKEMRTEESRDSPFDFWRRMSWQADTSQESTTCRRRTTPNAAVVDLQRHSVGTANAYSRGTTT